MPTHKTIAKQKSHHGHAVAEANSNQWPFFKPLLQTKPALPTDSLSINRPNDAFEREADDIADTVMRMPDSSKATFFSPGQRKISTPTIQKQDAKNEPKSEEQKTDANKEEAKVGFVDTESLKKTFDDLVLKLPDRYKDAYEKYKKTHEIFVFDLSESRKLASNEIMALWNLSNALVYKATSPYKDLGFGDSIKIAESLSGATDTYINLASLIIHKDLKKYLSDELPDTVKKNLGILIITGLLLQGGVSAVGYAINKEIDFVTLINPILSSYTEVPVGLNNPFLLGNIPDPRWKYPFLEPSPGLDINLSKFNPEAKTPSLNVNLGLNFASLLSLYPKNEEEKKKYKGLEIYPFFNYAKAYSKEGQAEPEKTDKYFAGVFIGNKGIYTMVEGGVITGPLGIMESYGRTGLVLKNLPRFQLWRMDVEANYRQATDTVRTRLNSAAQIEIVDNTKWQFIVGGTVGGLIRSGSLPGSFDYGASAELYYKQYSSDKKDMYKTGGEIGFTSRLQDPFEASSPQLFTLKTGLVFKGMLKLGLQYDKISETGPLNTFPILPPGMDLPQSNVTLYGAFDFAPLLYRNEKK